MNDVIRLLNSHRSIRKFKDKKIKKEIIIEIVKAAQRASTSKNLQFYSIINVTDPIKKEKISVLANKQDHIKQSGAFLVFCADLNRSNTICKMKNKKLEEGYVESLITATVDTALAAQNAMIAAESLGIGGVYVGGIRNNPREISDILRLPSNVYPVFGMSLGYPAQEPEVKPRLPIETILKENTYNDENDAEIINEYDKIMTEYYQKRTGGKKKEKWTEDASNAVSGGEELRPHMKEFLIEQGFNKK